MTALELIESLNLLDENEHIEAKRASEAGKSILETICAFANEPGLGGGWLLTQKGRGSATYYVPTERLLDSDSSSESEALSTKAGPLSTNLDDLSTMLTEEQDAQRKALLNELPGALAAKIGAIGQRHPPGEVCDAIVEICPLRDWRAEELATLLQRHSRYVRNNYLRLLMRDGRVAMINPNEPSDPQQAYRASEDSQ